jgi:hypothetical protein
LGKDARYLAVAEREQLFLVVLSALFEKRLTASQ